MTDPRLPVHLVRLARQAHDARLELGRAICYGRPVGEVRAARHERDVRVNDLRIATREYVEGTS